ncbi:MAG: alkaline shock response membrane anchor protein AmaP [Oscillospiraceae bacterium]|nr:alkaline shock response membrane anchor protein AmaP [Oscillospiraceae bacterium]
MRTLYKILLIIVALICLIFSIGLLACYIPIPYLSDVISTARMAQWLTGFSIFLCALFLVLLLIGIFIPTKINQMTFPKEKGALQFSKRTVESTVRYSFADVDGIVSTKVRAKFGRQPEKTRIYVTLVVKDVTGLVQLSEIVQQKIEAILSASLDITVKSINIRVSEYRPNEPLRKDNNKPEPPEDQEYL